MRKRLNPIEQRSLEIAEMMSHEKQGFAWVPSDAAATLAERGFVTILGSGMYSEKKVSITDAGLRQLGMYRRNGEERYYIWVVNRDGTPKDEGPYGPFAFINAKTSARIAATEGAHDRAVSIGHDPSAHSFQIMRRYEAGTGRRIQ